MSRLLVCIFHTRCSLQSHVVCIKTIINHDIKGPCSVNVLLTMPAFFQKTLKQDSFIDPPGPLKKDDIRPINTWKWCLHWVSHITPPCYYKHIITNVWHLYCNIPPNLHFYGMIILVEIRPSVEKWHGCHSKRDNKVVTFIPTPLVLSR